MTLTTKKIGDLWALSYSYGQDACHVEPLRDLLVNNQQLIGVSISIGSSSRIPDYLMAGIYPSEDKARMACRRLRATVDRLRSEAKGKSSQDSLIAFLGDIEGKFRGE